MPLPALAAAGIAAGATALSTGGQIYASGKMNKATRDWNEMMYGKQRMDQIVNWMAENQYNHPSQQMQRLREAGLNPNLVYGTGAVASGGSIKGADVKSWNPTTPDFKSLGNAFTQGLGSYYDVALQQEQIKNLVQQRKNMEMDNALKGIVASGKETANLRSKLDLDKSQALFDTSIQMAKQNLSSAETKQMISIAKNSRESQLAAHSMDVMFERAVGLRNENARNDTRNRILDAQLDKIKADGVLKQIEAEMMQRGINKNDPFIIRELSNLSHGKGSVIDAVKAITEYVEQQ